MKRLSKIGIFISLIIVGLIKGSVFSYASEPDLGSLSVDGKYFRYTDKSGWSTYDRYLIFSNNNDSVPGYAFYLTNFQSGSSTFFGYCIFSENQIPSVSFHYNGSSTENSISSNRYYTTPNGNKYYYISFGSDFEFNSSSFYDATSMNYDNNIARIVDELISNGITEPPPVGFIKASYAANGSDLMSNNASTFREYISWQPESTTGYDLTASGVTVQFAIRDNSYYSNSRISDPTNFYDWFYGRVSYLESYIYPSGSSRRSYMQGKTTFSPLNGQMRVVGRVAGSQLEFGFSPWNWYAGQQQDSVIKQFATDIQSGSSGGILQTLFPLHQSNADVCLSWDLYARIVPSSGTVGDWLKIDKHSVPVDQIPDRLDGGITQSPVSIPSFPDTDPGDWFTAPSDQPVTPEPDDTVNDDPLPVGLIDPQDGSPTYIYNNYTYNYDNRSWIENHYTNEYVEDTNEGLSWVKLFGGFFSLFLILFGAFLPEWAVALVAVASPVVVGLAVFKMVKGIIPFA